MKTNIFILLFASFVLMACEKKSDQANTSGNPKEISMEQKPQVLKSSKGDSISVVYFAEGDNVALKLTTASKEHKLTAKGTNEKGEPIFSDGELAWEMMEDGHSGRLTDKSGNAMIYK